MDEFPQKTAGDTAYSVVKGAVSNIPLVGGVLSSVLFENIFSSPIDKRKEEWFKRLKDSIDDLREKFEKSEEELRNDEVFISACLQASQVALRNHQEEKLKALQNAIINSVMMTLDENKKLAFIRFLDELTPLHIKILEFVSNPKKYENYVQRQKNNNSMMKTATYYSAMSQVWDKIYSEFRSSDPFFMQVVKELYARGLTFQDNMHGGIDKITTSLGDEFLTFIQEPTK